MNDFGISYSIIPDVEFNLNSDDCSPLNVHLYEQSALILMLYLTCAFNPFFSAVKIKIDSEYLAPVLLHKDISSSNA